MTLKRYQARPGDTIRIEARDVTHADTGAVETGLSGTVTLSQLATGDPAGGPFAISLHDGADWYVDIAAPATKAQYLVAIALAVGASARLLELQLDVV